MDLYQLLVYTLTYGNTPEAGLMDIEWFPNISALSKWRDSLLPLTALLPFPLIVLNCTHRVITPILEVVRLLMWPRLTYWQRLPRK